ncbi:MAG: hypothetical protein MUF18_04965 [Fimbriiglobus sp.]|nr:hypothetical protein [Fimbriiglobus sp.]
MRFRTLLDVAAVWGMRVAAPIVAPLLIVWGRTWHGRSVGVFVGTSWFGLLAVAYLDACSAFLLPGPGRATPVGPLTPVIQTTAVVLVLLLPFAFLWWCLSAAFLLFTQPAYRSDTPGLRSVFLGPLFLHRLQMMLLSEPDWVWLGTVLATRFDFRIQRDERRLIRDTVRLHLDELKASGESKTVPPALPLAIWGRILHPDHGHLFAYRPEAAGGERLGLLVFLHGHGGNAMLYPHLLRRFADDHRCVVVCPSFGYGNWEHPLATECVERAVRYAFEHFVQTCSPAMCLCRQRWNRWCWRATN